MTVTQKLMYLWLAVGLVLLIAVPIAMRRAKVKASGQQEVEKNRKIHNRYVRYNNSMLTRKRFRRIVVRYSSMGCYEWTTVKKMSVQLFERAMFVSILMPVLAMILLNNILLAILVGFVGYIYYDLTVDRAIDKVYLAILDELSLVIQSIATNYKLTDSIPVAILQADKGQYLEKPIMQIYEILTALDGDDLLYKYKQSSPIRLLGTLATVCYISNEQGDSGENGQSTIDLRMTALRQECDAEVYRLKKAQLAFKSLSTLALVGLAVSPIIDKFLLTQMPGTSVLLHGMYGAIEKVGIVIVTGVAYYIISALNKPAVVNQVDVSEMILKISRRPRMEKFVKNLVPKKFKTRYRLRALLNDALSSKTLEYIYTAKVVTAVALFVGALLFEIGFVQIAKSNLWNNYGALGLVADTVEHTERMDKQLREVDHIYMTSEYKMSDEEATALMQSKVTGLNAYEIENQVSRLSQKWDAYYSLGFKWYYVLVAYAFGVVGWFSQEIAIMLRKKLVQYEAAEDVMQLQTVMITLSDTTMDVPQILRWLMLESTVHKAPLEYAYLEYSSDPELALDRLKDSVGNKDLKRLVSKLEQVSYNLSVSDAFSDIALDKESMLQNYTLLQDEELKSKKEWASLIASAPIYISIFCGLVLPIFILGLTQLMSAFASMT